VRVDHVGIAVADLDAAVTLYTALLGGRVVHRESLEREGVRLAFVDVAGLQLELLAPTAEEGPLARFIRSRGEGLHHLAVEVPDVAQAIAEFAAAGQQPIDAAPRPGARGRMIAFLHPAAAHGVLIELVGPAASSDITASCITGAPLL